MVGRRGIAGAVLAGTILSCSPAPPAEVRSSDGVLIHFEAHGEGTRTLVFVHGWGCDLSYWTEQVTHFSQAHRVVLVDLAGHGSSEADRSAWTIANFSKDVVAVVEHLELDDVILVGHSLGAPVALEAGILLGPRAKAVIHVDAWGQLDLKPTPESQSDFLELFEPDYAEGVRSWVSARMFVPASDTSLVARIAEDMAQTPAEVGLAAFNGVYNWRHARTPNAFLEFTGPQYLLNADRTTFDPAQREQHGRAFAEFSIPDVGHFPMLEAPDVFNAVLDQILADIRGQ